jgi:hypothetical protein
MGQQFFTKARNLSRREILDLVRAGLVLAMTVGMALAVPPRVLGAVEATAHQTHVEATTR